MNNSALVVIDLQNDITKNYKEIIGTTNQAIDWAVANNMDVVYIQHNNLSAGTRTFKPNTHGAEFVPELKIVSDYIFTKAKSNALTSEEFVAFIQKHNITEFFITGADATACVKSTCYNMHSSYARTGEELKSVEARLREIQPLIKNISNYQKLKPVYDAFTKAKDKSAFRSKHEAELVIFEAAKSTLVAMQGDQKLPSLKSLQAEQQRLLEDQQRLYDERAKLKKEARVIDTMKANVDDFLSPTAAQDRDKKRSSELE